MRQRKKTKRIIFHHSLSSKGDVDLIRQWHTDPKPYGRGWLDIGYHYVITRDGEIQQGRDFRVQGAHSYGRNADSIGVCLVGDFRYDPPTPKQLLSSAALYHDVCRLYGALKIEFHRRLTNPCPGKNLCRKCFINLLRARIV